MKLTHKQKDNLLAAILYIGIIGGSILITILIGG